MSRVRTALGGTELLCIKLLCGVAAIALLTGCSVDGAATKAAGPEAGAPTEQPDPTTAPSGAPVPADGAFRITSSEQVRVVVTVIEDMACPACRAFESAYAGTLDDIAALPGAAVDYRIISFLDRMSEDEYSSRAANASYCVWNRPGDAAARSHTWLDFQKAAFGAQPPEGGRGLPDTALVSLAKTAGAPDVARCITDSSHAADVKKTTEATMSESSFSGTPTVRVNGQNVETGSLSTLTATVKGLLSK